MVAPIRFVAYDLLTGVWRAEIPFDTVTFGQTLNSASSFDATLPGGLPQADRNVLDPWRTIVYVEQAGEILGDGIIQRRSPGTSLRAAGQGWWSYFAKRSLKVDRTYTAQDQFTVVADLIAYAQSVPQGNPLGVTVRNHPDPSGVLVTKAWKGTDRKGIVEAVDELAQAGFEYVATSQMVAGEPAHFLDVWSPRIGRDTDIVWHHGPHVTITAYDEDGSNLANEVDAVGATVGSVKQIGTSTTALPSTYPLLEGTVNLTDETSSVNLVRQANAEQARRVIPAATGTLTLNRLDLWPLGSWIIGDTVQLVANDPSMGLAVDGPHRIVSWKADYQTNGTLTVSIDVDGVGAVGKPLLRPVPRFLAEQRELARTVARLTHSI